ncbi:MAG: PepSY domain-containing protein [Pseudoalteromonas sp.]|uniref:PepSY domain-containing protein n=1 Tax=unclassified Pseudoalteromonas TaxID=194690 RepID=UPI003F9D8CE8
MRILFTLSIATSILFLSTALNNVYANQSVQKAEVSKKQAVELAKGSQHGKTLKITEQTNVYTVRILKTDGHVIDVHINKKTGKVKKD